MSAETINNWYVIELFMPVDLPDGQFCSIVMEIQKKISPSISPLLSKN
jgi:hypothetical protein